MSRRSGGLDPNTALEISIGGTAGRLAGDDISAVEALTQLRDLAGGRTDLLGKAAGAKIGGLLGQPKSNPLDLLAAYYLMLAGADHDAMVAEADVVRARVDRSVYGLTPRSRE